MTFQILIILTRGMFFTVLFITIFCQSFNPTIEVCSYKNYELYCKYVTEIIPGQFLPQNSCYQSNCDNCIREWLPYFCSDPYNCHLMKGKNVLSQYADISDTGQSNIFECQTSCEGQDNSHCKPTNCDCSKVKCKGDFDYCKILKCDYLAACHCKTKKADIYLKLEVEGLFLDCYAIVNYLTCYYLTDKKVLTINIESESSKVNKDIYTAIENITPEDKKLFRKRKLLSENEMLTFQAENLTVKFRDPVMSFSTMGTLILRKNGIELVSEIKIDLKYIIPLELTYHDGPINFIFLSGINQIVRGKFEVTPSSICLRINCIFCTEILHHLNCLPDYITYVFVVIIIMVLTTICCYIGLICSGITAVVRIFIKIGKICARCYAKILKFFIKVGVVSARICKKFLYGILDVVRKCNSRVENLYGGLVIILLWSLIFAVTFADDTEVCNDVISQTSKNLDCTVNRADMSECKISTQTQLTLPNKDHSNCLTIMDKNNNTLLKFRIKLLDVECTWDTETLYYTSAPVMFDSSSEFSCYRSDFCNEKHCNPNGGPESLKKLLLTWPGKVGCITGSPHIVKCGYAKFPTCMFYSYWIIPTYSSIYEIRNILGSECSPILEITMGNVKEKIKGPLYNSRTLQIYILGTLTKSMSQFTHKLIMNTNQESEAYLDQACEFNRPIKTQIGEIQMNNSTATDFIFDPDMVTCTSYYDTLFCTKSESYLDKLILNKKDALPKRISNHYFEINQGNLVSKLIQVNPVVVNIKFENHKITTRHTKVCVSLEKVTIPEGCYACLFMAELYIRAKSMCSAGEANVSFKKLVTVQRIVSLTTEFTHIKIQFKTSEACHNDEELCLTTTYGKDCMKLPTFCLKAPTINISKNVDTMKTNHNELKNPARNPREWDYDLFDIFSWIPDPFSSITALIQFLTNILILVVILCITVYLLSFLVSCYNDKISKNPKYSV